ncbi:MAG: HAD-IIIA family hydrolase [Armatimonadetes bacterium]|nr:HAD-IIIA family hydrolase [Armatimonadota bacterium]
MALRLAQITDLHLRWHQPGGSPSFKRRSRLMPELLAEAIEQIKTLDVDLLALTGDVLDVPDYVVANDEWIAHDRAQWLAEAEQDYRLIRELLDASGLLYRVLPGNHDNQGAMARVFGHQSRIVEVGGHRVVCFWDREGEYHVPRRLGAERIMAEEQLALPGPQVHLQHYLLAPDLPDAGWPYNYLEAAHMRRTVVESGRVRFCLAGHYHDGTELERHGDTWFGVGPAFGVRPYPYRVYTIDDNGVTQETFRLREAAYEAGRPAVFLDRDGVLTVAPSYRSGPEDLELVPGAGAALRRLADAGYVLVAVSSQSAIGYGYVTNYCVNAVFDELARGLWRDGVALSAARYTAVAGDHAVHPQWAGHHRAKPAPDLLLETAAELDLDLSRSWMIGDNLGDLQAGLNAGVQPLLVLTGHGQQSRPSLASHPALASAPVADDISAAAEHILRQALPVSS